MKALSLWQPWATLVAMEAKRIETRSWATSYRGPLLICSAKRPLDRETREWMEFEEAVPDSLLADGALPLGVALCVVNLADCIPTGKGLIRGTVREARLGNFEPGRFGWILEGVRRLVEPLPIRGAQGLFDVSAEVEAEVRRRVEVWEGD